MLSARIMLNHMIVARQPLRNLLTDRRQRIIVAGEEAQLVAAMTISATSRDRILTMLDEDGVGLYEKALQRCIATL